MTIPTKAIPTKDYARQYRALWPEISAALERCFFEDEPVLGAAVERFERALAAWHGARAAVGLNSGTDAALLLYRALDLGPGDEVVTCAHTFSGVVSAILLAGLRPVLVDADPATGLLAPAAVERAIGPRTRAVLAVHLYGHPVDVDALAPLCASRGVHLIEDTAQAHGATLRGRRLGCHGAGTILSFHPSKNLGAFGDGGAVLTNDEALAARLRVLRNLGKDGKYAFAEVGTNSKLDTIQAALLEVKLRHLEVWVARRRALARRYLEGLHGLPDLELPADDPGHAWHLFVVRTPRRDALRESLAAAGVKTGLHYPIAPHRQPGLAPHFAGASFPVAEAWADTVVTLPLSHEHTDDEIDRAIAAVRRFFGA